MPEHTAMAAMILVRSPTIVEVVDDKDRDRDNRVVVACLAVVLGNEANSVPVGVICMASRVTVERSALFVRIRDHHCQMRAHITRASRIIPEPAETNSVPSV